MNKLKGGMRGRDIMRDYDHHETVKAKADKVQTLDILLKMHEAARDPDVEYIRGLRQRLLRAKNQLYYMRP